MYTHWYATDRLRSSAGSLLTIQIAWLYWPEELPPPAVRAADQETAACGKRKYHGNHELVASNYMEVLDVLSFAGKAEVWHWPEDDDNLLHKLYWRQTFCRETQALSVGDSVPFGARSQANSFKTLRKHCICDGYFNPDVAMYICDNPTCRTWLHKECLLDSILSKVYKAEVTEGAGTNGVAKPNGKRPKAKPYKGIFSAVIKEEADVPPMAFITDLRPNADPKTWSESIACPKCDTVLQQ